MNVYPIEITMLTYVWEKAINGSIKSMKQNRKNERGVIKR